MRSDAEDDALSWGDESDPTHIDAPADSEASGPMITRGTSSGLLVMYGVFAGAYLLYIVGWVIAVQRDTITLPTLFGEIMYQFGEFLAIAAPAIWFAIVLALTRDRGPLARLALLVVGLVVVAPWPFILGAA